MASQWSCLSSSGPPHGEVIVSRENNSIHSSHVLMASPKLESEAEKLSTDINSEFENRPGSTQCAPETSTRRPSMMTKGDTSRKRKSPDSADVLVSDTTVPKKVKGNGDGPQPLPSSPLPSDLSLLPAEVWHRIFTFTPPRTLGNLLRTSRLFNVYLNPSSTFQLSIPRATTCSQVLYLKPDTIWQASRRQFWPRMPTPLEGRTEIFMWKLACHKRCYFCNKIEVSDPGPTADKGHAGPGTEGVSVVWNFALKSCGPCLLRNTIKEIDLLLSPSIPSTLLPGLPFVFITHKMHVLSPDIQSAQALPDAQLTKIFLRTDVDQLVNEFNTVRSLGDAAVEEWLKGLDERGKRRRADPSRWEKWATADGLTAMRTLICPGVPASPSSGDTILTTTATPASTGGPRNTQEVSTATPSHDHETASTIIAEPSKCGLLPQLQPSAHSKFQPFHNIRTRTKHDVSELKAARRAEIERRASKLQPPLTSNVLAHIPSFQAAIQITAPLDDNAWELLKPRLLAQRSEAEQQGSGEPQMAIHPRKVKERLVQEPSKPGTASLESKQLIDKNWDDAQAPLRAQISAYADEIIQDRWEQGDTVGKNNSHLFAANVLLHVWERFNAEIARNAAAAWAAGRKPICDPPEGPFTQKLTLENMRWLFDVKIKPHTESFRKELFLCNGCGGNQKLYGLEGVVQHYAAKHTSAFTRGNVVVYWRAEWPETPPFRPDPQIGSHTRNSSHPASSAHVMAPLPAPDQFPPYNPPLAPTPYAQPIPWDHVQSPQSHPPGSNFDHHQFYRDNGFEYYPQSTHHPYYMGDSAGNQWPYLEGTYEPPQAYPAMENMTYDHNYYSYQANSRLLPQPAYTPADVFGLQLEDVARNARELWGATTGLKAISGSARVQVVIYHTAKRFRLRYSENLPLTMFIHGLSHNREMRPVRNVNGLVCKACNFGSESGIQPDRDGKSLSLPQLVNHFQQKHVGPLQRVGVQPLDWTVAMISAPDNSTVAKLHHSSIDAQQISFFWEAFPNLWGESVQGIADAPQKYWHDQGRQQGITDNALQLSAEQLGNSQRKHDTLSASHHHSLMQNSVTHEPNAAAWTVDKLVTAPERLVSKASLGDVHITAEEEQRRQEEGIRAMWASERAETARLAPSTAPPPAIDDKGHSPVSAQSRKAIPEHVDDTDEEDLTADLVSYLNQQELSSRAIDPHSKSTGDTAATA